MAPFCIPKVVVSGVKERIDSLLAQGDRLYLGSSLGHVHVYGRSLEGDDSKEPSFQLLETRKSVARKSIEQMGFIKDVNSLVVLSEMTVTLLPLPTFSPPRPLVNAKAAFSFAVHTSIQSSYESDPKTLVTHLLIGCRRKAVLYTWKNGEPQDVREAVLPHSARVISFLDSGSACFAYTPTEYAIFTLSTMTASDISTPLPVTASSSAMGAFTGLTGYMTLGLMSKPKPIAAHIKDSEVIITKDVQGFFIGPDAKASRPTTLEWPAPPEDVAVMKPYILSVLPAGVTTNETTSQPSNSTLQIHSSLSLNVSQTLPFPFSITQAEPSTQPPNATLRLLTPSVSSLFLLSTPADKTAAANDGSQVWEFQMKPWDEQLDELVLAGEYSDALALLDTLDDASLPDKSQRRTQIRALNAVAQFRDGHFDQAIDTFIELDFNPAKVVALYPETISGRLAVSQERWIPLYGGPERAATNPQPEAEDSQSVASNHSGSQDVEEKESPAEVPLTAGSLRNRIPFKTAFGSLIPGGAKDDDTASIMSKRKVIPHDAFHRSIETLVRFLTDRRPKLFKALETIKITPANQTEQYPLLSKTAVEDLFSLPNAPLSALTPEQLLRFAQVGDTALYRAYRIIRPTLVSTFCRSPNWCEVSELEEDLYKRKNFPALKDLYRARGMHAKALNLLQQVAEDEDDLEEKLDPSIQYLQQLGPEHLPQIFESARWVIDTNHDMGFNIFISDDVELPHRPVADYLESIEPKLCIRYLEHILVEKQDESSEFHDRLGELYLRQTLAAKKRGDDVTQEEMYSKLLHFLDGDQFISLDRLYGLISSTELYEARAILLGRLGRHDQALESYVYRLHDYIKAEEYCKRVYQPGTETEVIFLTLLRIYLRPTTQSPDTANLLKPALDLISRHSPRIDSVEILQLLPPLVTAQDVKEFLVDALRAPVFDARVISQVSKARNDHLARKLVGLQTRRVKVTDSRICPQCHKRIGNSVIAVHSPHGEVTHYQCREPFARKLAQTRR